MSDDAPSPVFRSPHIQEAVPDLAELARQARTICNERRLGFVIVVHDPEAVDSFIASNLPQPQALELLSLSANHHGHGRPKPIK